MTKLGTETKKVENAISKLKGELEGLNKASIDENINNKKSLISLLENLLENEDIQKKYPKYNKLKKLFYILPATLVVLLTIALIGASLIAANITFTTFLPLIIIAADYLTFHYASIVCDKKISDNEEYKPYYELYGDKKYSAKRSIKDLHLAEKDLEKCESLSQEYDEKNGRLNNLEALLTRLYEIRDKYVEQTLQDSYSQEEIEEISTLFTEEAKPKQYFKH